MFHFPFGKIVDSLSDSGAENEIKRISQMMRGGEDVNAEDVKAVLNFYISLYGDTPGQKGLGEKILSFNFQVLSENNPLYANSDKYKPKEDEITLGQYLKNYVEVGSQDQKSVIQGELQPVDPQQPQQEPESDEIKELRKQLARLEGELEKTRQPDHGPSAPPPVGVSAGLEDTLEEQRRKKSMRAKPIQKEIDEIEARIRTLKEATGGGKKKRTYKKKKRRSKKKRTPIKRRNKYKE